MLDFRKVFSRKNYNMELINSFKAVKFVHPYIADYTLRSYPDFMKLIGVFNDWIKEREGIYV